MKRFDYIHHRIHQESHLTSGSQKPSTLPMSQLDDDNPAFF